ncbi:MAG: FHA domain-containing protein [Thioalkalivibrionaceae bacterium]
MTIRERWRARSMAGSSRSTRDRGPQGTVFVDASDLPDAPQDGASVAVMALHPTLVVLAGLNSGDVFVLDQDRVRIGRRPSDADVVLDAEGVSFLHAMLVRHDSEWQIIDALSTNGLFVNGRRVSETNLSDGDQIQLGSVTLKFVAPDAALVAARRRRLWLWRLVGLVGFVAAASLLVAIVWALVRGGF